jgi:hypothetical protein
MVFIVGSVYVVCRMYSCASLRAIVRQLKHCSRNSNNAT